MRCKRAASQNEPAVDEPEVDAWPRPRVEAPGNVKRLSKNDREVAHRAGFEPTTPRFVVWCSIQLSYRCAPTRPAGSVRMARGFVAPQLLMAALPEIKRAAWGPTAVD